MFSMIKNIVQLTHSCVIIYLTFSLYEINKSLPAYLVGAEIFTALLMELIKKRNNRHWQQVFFSLALVYALRPSQLSVLRYLFLAKIFYVGQTLADVSENFLINSYIDIKPFRILRVLFNFSRMTVVFYMFLGMVVIIYKYWAYLWTDPEKVLATHQILYYLIITGSSVGYGDFTPKNEIQTYFMIAFIPILVISFGIYFGNVIGCFDDLMAIIKENPMTVSKSTLLSEKLFGKADCENLINYIENTQTKNSTISQENEALAHNWISMASKHYRVHQPILMEILDPSESKEYKLLVASKLKRQFYPKNWTILEQGDIDEHIYMIDEGEVQAGLKTMSHGETFNSGGFFNRESSMVTFKTKTLVSVWAVSLKDLEQIGRSSVNLETKINKKVSNLSSSENF